MTHTVFPQWITAIALLFVGLAAMPLDPPTKASHMRKPAFRLPPNTIEELSSITETTSFAYTTRTGESRVRLVIPARECFAGVKSPAVDKGVAPPPPRNHWQHATDSVPD